VNFPAAVVFDLDGTLIDSRRDLATAVNRTRAGLGLPALPIAEVVGMVGEGARKLVARALGDALSGDALPGDALSGDASSGNALPGDTLLGDAVAGARFEEAFAAFLAHYQEVCLDATRPYPGVEDLLSRLGGRCPLAVLTNKPAASTEKILAGLDLAGRFAAVVAGDSLVTRKPDPEGIRHLASRLGAPLPRLLLVGDSTIDAATARAAPCPFALAEWGFTTPEERAALAADLRAASPGELAAALLGPGTTTGP
jgi:phosphoglycolate phosphatase